MTPLQAPSSADPFPWYDTLRAAGGPVRCPQTGLWLLARHADVLAALSHPQLRVRPEGRTDAPWLAGGAAAEVFRNHVRMSDGEAHRDRRLRLEAGLRTLPDSAWLQSVAAEELRLALPAEGPLEAMAALAVPLPLRCVARWLGLPAERRVWLAERAAAFAPALQPASGTGTIAAAQDAAAELLAVLLPEAARGALPFFAALTDPAGPGRPLSAEEAAANAIGLLAQTCDATAGLFGNGLRNLLPRPALRAALHAGGLQMAVLLEEVLRFDPPIHNTRRIAAAPVSLGGAEIGAGEALLLLLAAAGRDPEAFADAGAFRPERFRDGHRGADLPFGAGVHRCPGAAAARAIVSAALSELLRLRPALRLRGDEPRWRPAANARIPDMLWLEG